MTASHPRVDDEATYRSVFAPVDAIQAPKTQRTKKTAQPTKGNGGTSRIPS